MLPIPLAAALPSAAERGFSFADPYVIGLVFCGVAIFAAIAALSHQSERAFSASMIYLGLGLVAAMGMEALGLAWLDPIKDAKLLEKLTEFAVIVALFGTGLKLDRPFTWPSWSSVVRLLLVAMPLTIGIVVLFGTTVMGLSLGAAVALGAILAPTDPVLAGDVGVGPPGQEQEREPNFSLTGEAGLNDGLAFPFLFAGLFIIEPGGTDWLGTWFLADVLYAIVVAVGIGAVVGYGIGAAAVRLRNRNFLTGAFDAWVAIPSVLVIYGLTEVAGAYGFIAAFVGGLAFRRYERTHELKRRVHDGAEVVEKIAELTVILLLGSLVTFTGLAMPGLTGWLLVPALLLLIRPVAVGIALLRSPVPRRERSFIGWFGVRGIGSLYYLAVVVGGDRIASSEAEIVAWTAIGCVIVSIVVHGITAAPLSRRLLPEQSGG